MTINCLRDLGDNYITFIFSGDKLLSDVSDISNEICNTLQEFTYKKIIIDFSETEKQLFFLDWVKVAKVIHKEFRTHKIAMVDCRKQIEEKNTVETLLFNSGIIFRTFDSLEGAKNWIAN